MKLSKVATILLILMASIIACLPSCGGMGETAIRDNMRQSALSADTITMPDGHVYFYNVGGTRSSMCHAEGFCKKHK
jgi:hypothetical protein